MYFKGYNICHGYRDKVSPSYSKQKIKKIQFQQYEIEGQSFLTFVI